MTGPLGPSSLLASGRSSNGTVTPVNITSIIFMAIIIVSCDFSLPTNRRGHGVFGPCLAGWYEQNLTLLFIGRADWGPICGSRRYVRELTLMFVGGYNRCPLGGSCRGSTSPSPCCPNPSSLTFWLGFFYNFSITKIRVIVVSRGRIICKKTQI